MALCIGWEEGGDEGSPARLSSRGWTESGCRAASRPFVLQFLGPPTLTRHVFRADPGVSPSFFLIAPFPENLFSIYLRQPLQPNEESLLTIFPRALRFLAMHLVEHCFQALFEGFVFGALIELADEVPADFQGVVGEVEGGTAEVLGGIGQRMGYEGAGEDIPLIRRDRETRSQMCSSS
jgi:hypothetical protein